MNKKILISLSVIVAVAAIVVGGTTAYFSDTETSQGNTFTAGAIDLTVDSQQHYNGNVCVWDGGLQNADGTLGAWVWQGDSPYPEPGLYCDGSWEATDLGAQQFFNFADIKPGDKGENTISLHVINNDAWVCAAVSNLSSDDNGCTEPESDTNSGNDTTCGNPGVGEGELDDTMVWTIWRDDGVGERHEGKCDNIHQDNEAILASGHPVNGVLPLYDSTTQTGPLAGGQTSCLGVSWSLPLATGNEVQTDSMTGDISFSVVQSRNNEDFRCVPLDVYP